MVHFSYHGNLLVDEKQKPKKGTRPDLDIVGTRLLGLHPNLVHAARKWPALEGVLDGLRLREIGHWRAHHDATPFVLHVADVT